MEPAARQGPVTWSTSGSPAFTEADSEPPGGPAGGAAGHAPSARPASGSPTGPGPRYILVVEDEPTIAEVMEDVLVDEGFLVRSAREGGEALALMRERVPDLVLLDLMMPGMDGWRFLGHVRADPHLADVPVVLATTRTDAPTIAAEFQARAALRKPFDLDELTGTIRRVLGLAE